MSHLTKRELVVRISNETGMVQAKVLEILHRTLEHLTQSLSRGQKVELRNFGVFEVKHHRARMGRNPNRPEHDVPIPARVVVKFRAGKSMKSQVTKLINMAPTVSLD